MLQNFYEWNRENNPNSDSETFERDMAQFANQMQRLQALVAQTE